MGNLAEQFDQLRGRGLWAGLPDCGQERRLADGEVRAEGRGRGDARREVEAANPLERRHGDLAAGFVLQKHAMALFLPAERVDRRAERPDEVGGNVAGRYAVLMEELREGLVLRSRSRNLCSGRCWCDRAEVRDEHILIVEQRRRRASAPVALTYLEVSEARVAEDILDPLAGVRDHKLGILTILDPALAELPGE
ncbi:hypothetical protein ACFPRL_07165 [Pseudoclavibacter helvolus]